MCKCLMQSFNRFLKPSVHASILLVYSHGHNVCAVQMCMCAMPSIPEVHSVFPVQFNESQASGSSAVYIRQLGLTNAVDKLV